MVLLFFHNQELDSRYNALLQMYGEKEEKVQELLLDLEDVKDMYKQQVNTDEPVTATGCAVLGFQPFGMFRVSDPLDLVRSVDSHVNKGVDRAGNIISTNLMLLILSPSCQ